MSPIESSCVDFMSYGFIEKTRMNSKITRDEGIIR